MTFKFIPTTAPTTETPTPSETTSKLPEKQIDCPSGENQTTAFTCGKCSDGFNCAHPKNPILCEEGTYADATSTFCNICEIGIGSRF